MKVADEEINTHLLFIGLTRPPMYAGVTITFLGINLGLGLIIFVLSSSFIGFFIFAGIMHTLGYVCCLYDPRIFDLLLGWFQTKSANRNMSYWGCYSYDAF